MKTQEIIAIIILLIVVVCCKKAPKAPYQVASGGLQKRPMPEYEYINGPYESADERYGIVYAMTM